VTANSIPSNVLRLRRWSVANRRLLSCTDAIRTQREGCPDGRRALYVNVTFIGCTTRMVRQDVAVQRLYTFPTNTYKRSGLGGKIAQHNDLYGFT